jgi:cyclopropane fatty-acyl-phospholipid synthase-like methyltransferase
MKNYKYQNEYELSPCFWGTNPAKYVRKLAEYLSFNLSGLKILDLGAGEGKNAVYFANLGGEVIAVDASATALSHFVRQPDYQNSKHRIQTINANVVDINLQIGSFDIVIAYGLFHCLESLETIYDLVRKIKEWTKVGGYLVGSAFTNEIPPPECQPYLAMESFLQKDELFDLFNDWIVLDFENDMITETHPTSNIEHQHSLSRIIARKYDVTGYRIGS